MANTLDITFLGTSSAQPSITRNHSSLAVRVDGSIWIFDSGEGTQRQIMQSDLKLGKINKVFITHLHGDHVYGLPGLICTLTAALNPQNANANLNNNDSSVINENKRDPNSTPCLDIYGPEGLRNYIRCALTFTYSRLPIFYRVHELKIPNKNKEEKIMGDSEKQKIFKLKEEISNVITNNTSPHPDELIGEDIEADENGHFINILRVEENKNNNGQENRKKSNSEKRKESVNKIIKVNASYISHSVPTLGYVLNEDDIPGTLKIELAKPLIMKNSEKLKESGVKCPMSLLRDLKQGKEISLPDGNVLKPSELLNPAKKGRKIVILGDTNDPSQIEQLAQNPTILIHEATNMYENINNKINSSSCNNNKKIKITHEKIEEEEEMKNEKEKQKEAEEAYRLQVMSRGHSTPEMAGRFAAKLNTEYLLINHFSSRYSSVNRMAMVQPDWNEETIVKIRSQQKKQNSLNDDDDYQNDIPQNYSKKDIIDNNNNNNNNSNPKLIKNVTCESLHQPNEKYLEYWDIMQQIKKKALSTFGHDKKDRIILSDDFLQVECHRVKEDENNEIAIRNHRITNKLYSYIGWNQDLLRI